MEEKYIIGYKSAKGCIVVLQLYGRNNLERLVVDINYAKYRGEEAIVLGIRDKLTGDKKQSIESDRDSKFVYEVGKIVKVNNYNPDIEEVCAPGIHFFLSKEAAMYYNFDIQDNYTGEYKKWDKNGQLWEQRNYVDGKRNLYTT